MNGKFDTAAIVRNLLEVGADRDTTAVYEREINGKPGAVGSGYEPKDGLTLFNADLYVSPKSYCHIFVLKNQSEMVSAMKTIHVQEKGYT